MELDYIYEFITLAKHKNFHAAADELGISQPTLTNHIKKLEAELNITLFDRNTRNIDLNEYGEAFFPYAVSLTEMYGNAVQAISAKRRAANIVLTVAVEPQYEIGSIIGLFSRYKEAHPGTVIEFTNASQSHAYSFLRSGRCDLAILPQAESEKAEFNTIPLREEHAVALVHRDHALAGSPYIEISDLVGQQLFIPPARLVLYRLLEAAYHDGGYELDPNCMGITELMGMLLTRQGQGVMIMSDYAAKKYADDSLRILEIRPALKWHVNLLFPNTSFSSEGKTLIHFIQSALTDSDSPIAF